jgi:hypothetical protein
MSRPEWKGHCLLMNANRTMNYVEAARAVLGAAPATKATEATEGVLERVWRAGGRLVISTGHVRAVGVPRELSTWVTLHGSEVVQVLQRTGGGSR